jgi:hypothetical protein
MAAWLLSSTMTPGADDDQWVRSGSPGLGIGQQARRWTSQQKTAL